jgi:hypothetical protein
MMMMMRTALRRAIVLAVLAAGGVADNDFELRGLEGVYSLPFSSFFAYCTVPWGYFGTMSVWYWKTTVNRTAVPFMDEIF